MLSRSHYIFSIKPTKMNEEPCCHRPYPSILRTLIDAVGEREEDVRRTAGALTATAMRRSVENPRMAVQWLLAMITR